MVNNLMAWSGVAYIISISNFDYYPRGPCPINIIFFCSYVYSCLINRLKLRGQMFRICGGFGIDFIIILNCPCE